MTGAVSLEVQGLSARHGSKAVLTQVSFQCRAGRVRAVLGPNGAGKSTLLRTLLGVHPLAGGEVRVEGEVASRLSARELAKRLAWVPQHFDDSAGFTALELVLMGRTPHVGLFGLTTAEDSARAAALLAEVGLSGMQQRRVSTLSGGEQRLVLLARALLQSPRVLLLDEPTAFLDPRHQVAMLERLRGCAREGMAVLAVLHEVNLAAAFADDVLLLKAGAVVADGPTAEVLTAPALEALYGLPLLRAELDGQALFAPLRSR